MKISEIMSVNSIVLSLKANNKRQLLQALAEKAAEITGISERTILTPFWNVRTWVLPASEAEPPCRTAVWLN